MPVLLDSLILWRIHLIERRVLSRRCLARFLTPDLGHLHGRVWTFTPIFPRVEEAKMLATPFVVVSLTMLGAMMLMLLLPVVALSMAVCMCVVAMGMRPVVFLRRNMAMVDMMLRKLLSTLLLLLGLLFLLRLMAHLFDRGVCYDQQQ